VMGINTQDELEEAERILRLTDQESRA